MPKQTMIISTIAGEKRALVKGQGWIAINKIKPNENVKSFVGEGVEWTPFKTKEIRAQEERHRLLAEGYVNDLYE